jgi:hypothetical protein
LNSEDLISGHAVKAAQRGVPATSNVPTRHSNSHSLATNDSDTKRLSILIRLKGLDTSPDLNRRPNVSIISLKV